MKPLADEQIVRMMVKVVRNVFAAFPDLRLYPCMVAASIRSLICVMIEFGHDERETMALLASPGGTMSIAAHTIDSMSGYPLADGSCIERGERLAKALV